uniref:Uncharacterized protein n=1 Tax=Oryza punctata TaxID=4537 RepID=A0A0E0L1L9_ORYPU
MLQKENMQNLQEDGANLSVLELRRKRARERYASMSPKKKEARKMKAHVYKKKKEESLRLNQTPNNYVKAPLGDITNVSADDLRSCHVNDCSTLQQRSVARRPMITPRHLPFTVINNVTHYDDMEHTGSPFSRILQGTTENSQTTTVLPANIGKFIVFLLMKFCVHSITMNNTNIVNRYI